MGWKYWATEVALTWIVSMGGQACVWAACAPADGAVPLGLPRASTSGFRGQTNLELARLGSQLFRDTDLSAGKTMSCAKCHLPDRAFADGRGHALGARAQSATRNTPSLLNVAYSAELFWDGRVSTLDAQIRSPLLNPLEHGFTSEEAVAEAIRGMPKYSTAIQRIFHIPATAITITEVAQALAEYERTLLAGDSPFDRFLYGRDRAAMSAAALRGLGLFRDRGRCSTCHLIGDSSALLTDQQFHTSPLPLDTAVTAHLAELAQKVVALRTAGRIDELNALVSVDVEVAALGRFVRTLNPGDIGKFRTPSLRNVAVTGPYMHDGSVPTLEEAVDLELYGRGDAVNYPIALTTEEKTDLTEFLRSLTSEPDASINRHGE